MNIMRWGHHNPAADTLEDRNRTLQAAHDRLLEDLRESQMLLAQRNNNITQYLNAILSIVDNMTYGELVTMSLSGNLTSHAADFVAYRMGHLRRQGENS